MNEIGGAIRLRCLGPTLSACGRPPLPSSLFRRPTHRFCPCLSTAGGTTPTVLLLPSVKYGRPSPFRCSGSCDVAEPEPPVPVPEPEPGSVNCVGTGADVECVVVVPPADVQRSSTSSSVSWWEWVVLVSPFFFWGTAMVAMKPVLPKTGPLFVSAFRLIPAGLLLVAFAASRRRSPPSGFQAWLSISLFALVDASCFQVLPLRFLLFLPGYFFCLRPGLTAPFPC